MDGMRYWIEAEGNGHYFFYAFPFAMLLLLVLLKKQRVHFVLPTILITIIIANPWFYKKWYSIGQYAYWRVLWVIPVIPCLAALPASLSVKIKNSEQLRLKVFSKVLNS